MAERIHPREDSPPHSTLLKTTSTEESQTPQSPTKPVPPQHENPVPQPPPGTYVIQIPKDQVYRVPPPENAKRYQHLSGRKPRYSCCRCCLCSLLGLLIAVVFLAGLSAGILYLVFRPESPDYSIESMSINGFNLTSSGPVAPEFNVTFRANNPNNKIGLYYRSGSSVNVYYGDVRLGSGVWPVFYQGSNNVTVFSTLLTESGIELTGGVRKELVDGQRNGTVPFNVKLRVPVRIKVGSVKTWRMTFKVDCDLTVDKLTANGKIVQKDCDYGVNIW